MDGFARHTPVLTDVKVIRALSVDSALMPSLNDALSKLANDFQWLEVGDSVPDIVQSLENMMSSWLSYMNIGTVSMFLGSLPDGWLSLDGTTYDEADYPELYAQLDSQYVNEIAETFTLPDMANLFPVPAGDDYVLGDSGGLDSVTLSIAEIPSHHHTYTNPVPNVDLEAPGVPDIVAAGIGPGADTGNTGSGEAHENLPPYYSLIFGIFAGRV